MNGSPVAGLVRGWVSLYTRGLPAEARAARRDEIDDDLWCEHAEADAAGHSTRSLHANLTLRLMFGIPSDISWRLSYRRAPTPPILVSSPINTRTLGSVAIVAGSSLALLGILNYVIGDGPWGWASAIGLVLAFGSLVAFPAAALGLAIGFHDRLGLLGAIGAILVTLGSALSILDPAAGGIAHIGGAAMLMSDLARIGVARRAAIAQLVALIPLIGLALLGGGHVSTPPIVTGVVLGGYLLSWVALGVWLIRGAPQAQETSA